MKAEQTSILEFMGIKHQFIIPVYQRTYRWSRKNCMQLLDDIIRTSRKGNDKTHFIGAIVYITDEYFQATKLKQLMIIDGQQRLTTISLLLAAIYRYLKENPSDFDTTPTQILKDYLVIDKNQTNNPNDYIVKLSLTRHDKEFYENLIRYEQISTSNHNIYNNYKYFYNEIKNRKINVDELFEGMSKLLTVYISLTRTSDDPQLIFESLNSTGVKLSDVDLIRNYILMGLREEFQNHLYKDFWFKMELTLNEDKNEFSSFIRDYLIIKAKKTFSQKNLYDEFKKYFLSNYQRTEESLESFIKDVYRYSQYYGLILRKNTPNKKINSYLKDFEALDLKVIYPLLLKLYNDFCNDILLEEELLELLGLIESLIVRRIICNAPTNSISKIVFSLIKDVNESNYVKSFVKNLLGKTGRQRFPKNEEFKAMFIERDFYSLKSCKFILEKIINNDNIVLNIDEFTIEHIMPQTNNLPQKWVKALGENWREVHSKYLHTIGNLTLVRNNAQLGTKFFTEKRDMPKGFKDSPCSLNKDLVNLDTWNENEIKNRALRIYSMAELIWSIPENNEKLENYNMILDFEDDWTGQKPTHFIFFDEKIEVKDVKDLYLKVLTALYELDPEMFINVISNDDDLQKRKFCTLNVEEFKYKETLLESGYYFNTNLSNEAKRKNLQSVVKSIGLTEEDLVIYLSAEEDSLI